MRKYIVWSRWLASEYARSGTSSLSAEHVRWQPRDLFFLIADTSPNLPGSKEGTCHHCLWDANAPDVRLVGMARYWKRSNVPSIKADQSTAKRLILLDLKISLDKTRTCGLDSSRHQIIFVKQENKVSWLSTKGDRHVELRVQFYVFIFIFWTARGLGLLIHMYRLSAVYRRKFGFCWTRSGWPFGRMEVDRARWMRLVCYSQKSKQQSVWKIQRSSAVCKVRRQTSELRLGSRQRQNIENVPSDEPTTKIKK